MARGAEVARSDAATIEFETDDPPRANLTAEVLSPCGWSSLGGLALYAPIPDTRDGGRTLVINAVTPGIWIARLWIDNRGGRAFQLSVGQMTFPVAAGFTDFIVVPQPACGPAVEVRLDDKPVGTLKPATPGHGDSQTLRGKKVYALDSSVDIFLKEAPSTLPPTAREPDTFPAYLIDPGGRRCYTYRELQYSRNVDMSATVAAIPMVTRRVLSDCR